VASGQFPSRVMHGVPDFFFIGITDIPASLGLTPVAHPRISGVEPPPIGASGFSLCWQERGRTSCAVTRRRISPVEVVFRASTAYRLSGARACPRSRPAIPDFAGMSSSRSPDFADAHPGYLLTDFMSRALRRGNSGLVSS